MIKKNQGPTAAGGPSGLPPPEPITALVVVGRGQVLHLSAAKDKFTLGRDPSPVTDLQVTTPDLPDGAQDLISRRHAMLYRDSYRLLLHDMSTNGTFVRDHKIEKDVFIEAGDTFRVSTVKLLALDEQLLNLRADLAMAIGLTAHATVDAALGMIVRGGHLLLVGPKGGVQRQLAQWIHERSARRRNAFRDTGDTRTGDGAFGAMLAAAQLGTLFVDLHDRRPLSNAAALQLFHGDSNVRAIVSAPDVDTAYGKLGKDCPRLDTIVIPPLADRRQDVPVLLDVLCAELPTERRIAELNDAWTTEGIAEFSWPGNHDEVREYLPWLLALVEHRQIRKAAKALGLPHTTLYKRLKRIGVVERKSRTARR